MKTQSIITLCFVLLLASCGVKSSFYQKQVPIPGTKWSSKFQPDFKVEIKDSIAKYDVCMMIRHDEAYPNSNIWFRFKVKAPGDSVFREGGRIEKDLADVEGKWLGLGMGGIWEHKIVMTAKETPNFARPGVYEIKIEQLMRNDPLPSVLNVGLRLERR